MTLAGKYDCVLYFVISELTSVCSETGGQFELEYGGQFDRFFQCTSGTGGKKSFDLPDTEFMLYDIFFTKEESDHYYNTLHNNTP